MSAAINPWVWHPQPRREDPDTGEAKTWGLARRYQALNPTTVVYENATDRRGHRRCFRTYDGAVRAAAVLNRET